jgi:hypothetical protein
LSWQLFIVLSTSSIKQMRSPKASTLERQPERQDRLDIAGTLYKSLVAEYPDKLIILHDDREVMLASTDESFLSEQ